MVCLFRLRDQVPDVLRGVILDIHWDMGKLHAFARSVCGGDGCRGSRMAQLYVLARSESRCEGTFHINHQIIGTS